MTTPHLIVAGAVLAVVGFTGGRISKRPLPAKVETKEVVRDVDHIVYKDKIVTLAAKERIVHRIVKVAVAPDGTKTKEVTTDSDTRAHAESTTETKAAAEHIVYQDREVRVTNDVRPTWHVGALGGVDLDRRVWWGGMVTHRLFGPLEAGAALVRAGDWNAGLVVGVSW